MPVPAVQRETAQGEDHLLLDVSGAAKYLGVTERFVRRLVAERRLPYIKVGRFVRFELSDLEDYIAANRFEATLA